MIYSSDLRQRVLDASDGLLTNQQVADFFQVSNGTVERWRRQRRETGQVSAGKSTGRPRAIPVDQEVLLRAQVEQMPDATLVDHCAQWAETTGRDVSTATMCRTLQRLNWTVKKSS
jgi:transposase